MILFGTILAVGSAIATGAATVATIPIVGTTIGGTVCMGVTTTLATKAVATGTAVAVGTICGGTTTATANVAAIETVKYIAGNSQKSICAEY